MTLRASWVFWALTSAAGFAVMAALVRHLSKELPQAELVFFRNATGLVFLLPLLAREGVSLRTECFGLHLMRAWRRCISTSMRWPVCRSLTHCF